MKLTFSYKELYIFFIILYIICLPLNAMNIGPMGSALRLFSVLPVGIAFLSGGRISFGKPITKQLMFVAFAFLSLVWTVDFDTSLGRVISYTLLFALLISGAAFKYTEEEINKIKYALAWSSRLTALVVLMFAQYVEGRLTLDGIIMEDPNYMCAYFAFGTIFALGVLAGKGTAVRKVFAAAELLVYLYLIFASGSRGGLIAIVAAMAIYLMTYGNKKEKKIFGKIVLLAVVIVIMNIIIEYLPETLRMRFTTDSVVEGGGSGRTQLWKQAIDLFTNSGIIRRAFGYGTASIMWCFKNYGYIAINVAHNIFIETMVELGIIGLILYTMAIFAFIKAAFVAKDKFAFAVICCMFVMSLSLSLYAFKPYFNIMLFIIMLQNEQRNEDGRIANNL